MDTPRSEEFLGMNPTLSKSRRWRDEIMTPEQRSERATIVDNMDTSLLTGRMLQSNPNLALRLVAFLSLTKTTEFYYKLVEDIKDIKENIDYTDLGLLLTTLHLEMDMKPDAKEIQEIVNLRDIISDGFQSILVNFESRAKLVEHITNLEEVMDDLLGEVEDKYWKDMKGNQAPINAAIEKWLKGK